MKTGFKDLDEAINMEKKLIFIGARPAMGKTRLVTNIIADVVIRQHIPTLMFSMEESKEQIIKRILASENRLDKTKINTDDLTEEEREKIKVTKENLEKSPLYIDDTPALTIGEIKQRVRKMKIENDVELIVIDYFELLDNKYDIGTVSEKLNKIAVELDVAIIITSQLSSEIDKREDKRPKISDLKQSSSFANVFDIIMFLYRDDIYDRDSEDLDILELTIAKNRYGDFKQLKMVALDEYSKFVDVARKF